MTPTLNGRIQSKLFLLLIVAPIWTVFVTVLLVPLVRGADSTMTASYGVVWWNAVQVLLWTAFFGIGWEFVWHALQQSRWEKDWPTLYGLVVAVNEGIVAYLILNAGLFWDERPPGQSFPLPAFIIMFITLWLIIWAFTNGPMQIVSLRWRHRGGRFDPNW